MNTKRFNQLVEQTLKSTKKTLVKKGDEYSTENNKLHNFDRGAQITGQSREKVLFGMALKHHISIADIRDQVEDGKLPSIEMVEEKFGDAINYLILEKASIIDRIEKRLAERDSEHIIDAMNYFRFGIPSMKIKPDSFINVINHKIENKSTCNNDCVQPPFQCTCKK